MFDHDVLYKIIDSHFVYHVEREGVPVPVSATQEDAANRDGQPGAIATAGASGEIERPDLPDNMLEDLLDELDEALEDLQNEFDYTSEELASAVIGFVDGVLASAGGEYSSFEDAYFEDSGNGAFAQADELIAEYAANFDGNRDWGEAAMGYLRHCVELSDAEPTGLEEPSWQARAQGFVYGADLCEDYEWRVMQTSVGTILVTDEEAIDEFSMRQLEASDAAGGLFGKVFDALGIDIGELEQALEKVTDEEDGEGASGE